MADQQPWWKLWTTALDDPHLEALSLEDWARWARLALVVKRHGDAGRLVSQAPHRTLATALRTRFRGLNDGVTVTRLCALISALPGVTVTRDEATGTIVVEYRNWSKYQYGSSTQRTRQYRDRLKQQGGEPASREPSQPSRAGSGVTVQEESRGESPYPPPSRNVTTKHPPEAFNHDCAWPGRCVNAEYFDAHPDAGLPVRGQDDTGRMRPKQCPTHRAQDTPAW
jgi:hypothetical protein